ncbi:hypothetical protein BDQ12DRAFT_117435 [Crucibulum laeve]|uniref:Uncharacterized protein n=1 Tax=Crucibulum laeve TaxID=68775 RepID=A0A5C3LZD9_9AGAR|nr:hypothetical protein BDQ12DRAFT_117435 [Crucibulum laeve]
MAAATLSHRQHSWPAPSHSHMPLYSQPHTADSSRPRFQYAPAVFTGNPIPPNIPLPVHNDIEMNREMLLTVLDYFALLIPAYFSNTRLNLVVHGGACMLLHEGLYQLSQQQHQLSPTMPRRTTTRDVDYIHRAFAKQLTGWGMHDAGDRMKACVQATARRFGLGADWMNADADVALPMANDPSGNRYDPIYDASTKPNNQQLHTIYRSDNGYLTLVSVTPFWAVSLKLVRYTKWDPGDICMLLKYGTILSKVQWTEELLQNWLFKQCWPMGYASYDSRKLQELKGRMRHAIQLISQWDAMVDMGQAERDKIGNISEGEVMGGGDVVGGEGWSWVEGQGFDRNRDRSNERTRGRSLQGSMNIHSLPMTSGLAPIAPQPKPVPTNIRDWEVLDPPTNARKSKSKSRTRLSTPEPIEIFIPSELDTYGHANSNPNEWLNPNHAPVRSRSGNPSPGPTYSHENQRRSLHTLSSFEDLDRAVSSMLRQGRTATNNHFGQSPGEPVIPPVPTSKSHSRKKKDKERDRAREQERISKSQAAFTSSWHPRDPGSDSTSSSDEEHDRRRFPMSPGGSYIYAPPGMSSRVMTPQHHSPQFLAAPVNPDSRSRSGSLNTRQHTPIPSPQEKHRPPPLPLGPMPGQQFQQQAPVQHQQQQYQYQQDAYQQQLSYYQRQQHSHPQHPSLSHPSHAHPSLTHQHSHSQSQPQQHSVNGLQQSMNALGLYQ